MQTIQFIQHLLKSIDYLSYRLKMKKVELLFQSIVGKKDFDVLTDGKRFLILH